MNMMVMMVTKAAVLAMGRINLEWLFRRRSADYAHLALEQISAERDILIFEKFWTDRAGKATKWENRPVKIFHACSDDGDPPDIADVYRHEMSRWGFQAKNSAPEACIAFFIYEPVQEHDREITEQAERIAEERGGNTLFRIDTSSSLNAARSQIANIAQALLLATSK